MMLHASAVSVRQMATLSSIGVLRPCSRSGHVASVSHTPHHRRQTVKVACARWSSSPPAHLGHQPPTRPLASRRCPAAAPRATSRGEDVAAAADGQLERQLLRALLLAFVAAQNFSALATQCLVETCVHLHRSGFAPDDLRVGVTFTSLGYPGRLMNETQEDILVSWASVVMLTLRCVGVPLTAAGATRLARRRGGAGPPPEDTSAAGLGLQGLVQATVERYLDGTDMQRLALMQSLGSTPEGDAEAAGPSPSVRVLQQNSRLVLLTLDFVRRMGLPSDVPALAPPGTTDYLADSEESAASLAADAAAADDSSSGVASEEEESPVLAVGYLPAFLPADSAPGSSSSNSGGGDGEEGAAARTAAGGQQVAAARRAAALRLLVGFTGAAQGIAYAADDFVDSAAAAYRRGWAAEELFHELRPEEFAQTGGVGPIGIARLPGGQNVGSALFARWLSLVYVTLAELGVHFPGSADRVGWAWVNADAAAGSNSAGPDGGSSSSSAGDEPGPPSTLEAYGLADFVVHTLNLTAEREATAAAAAAAPSDAEAAASSSISGGGKGAGGGSSGSSSRAAGAVVGVLATPPPVPHEGPGFLSLEDPQLARTSPTALLLQQQVELVRMARRRALAAQAAGGVERT